MDESRGANSLIGVTIESVDASAINQIVLKGTNGVVYVIDTEPGPYHIPVVVVEKQEVKKKGTWIAASRKALPEDQATIRSVNRLIKKAQK